MEVAKIDRFGSFGHYLFWWLFWGIGLGFIGTYGDLQARSLGAVEGVVAGLVCAVAFTLAQNSINLGRKKWLSWVLAISVLVSYKLLALLVLTQLMPQQ